MQYVSPQTNQINKIFSKKTAPYRKQSKKNSDCTFAAILHSPTDSKECVITYKGFRLPILDFHLQVKSKDNDLLLSIGSKDYQKNPDEMSFPQALCFLSVIPGLDSDEAQVQLFRDDEILSLDNSLDYTFLFKAYCDPSDYKITDHSVAFYLNFTPGHSPLLVCNDAVLPSCQLIEQLWNEKYFEVKSDEKYTI